MSLDLTLYKRTGESPEEEVDIWWRNITHNLSGMADHVPTGAYTLYQLLWRPDEHGFDRVTNEYIRLVIDAIPYMYDHRKELERFNPENGWGSYEGLMAFVNDYALFLTTLDLDDEEILIYASR